MQRFTAEHFTEVLIKEQGTASRLGAHCENPLGVGAAYRARVEADGRVMLHFTVIGVPQQMGSKRAFVPKGWTRPIITDSNRNLKAWQLLIAACASDAIQHLPIGEQAPLTDGVRLTVAFYLPRPKSLKRGVTAHTKAPDCDKLARGAMDALTRVAFRDDSQVCDLVVMKRYAADAAVPRAEIWVEPSAGVAALARNQRIFSPQPNLFTRRSDESSA